MIDNKTFNEVSQLGHFAGGAAIVLAFGVARHVAPWPVYGFVLVLVLAAIKEFWYDEKFETTEVRGSSGEDFLFYMVGAGAALLFSILFIRP